MVAAAFFLVLVLSVAAPSVYAVQHIVGGSGGWSTFGNYVTWAAGETFTVGDTLLFNYDSSHGVAELSKSDYDSCATSNAIKSHNGGQTTITLSKTGPTYFACNTIGHCGNGMKLQINVVAAGGSTPPTTPSAGTPPTTPSGTNLEQPTSETPNTPSTSTPTPRSTNGATGGFGMNQLITGFSVIFASVFAFMC